MHLIVEIIISFFIVLGGVFGLVGSYGMVKLSDTMQRVHAPTKATSLGIGGVLIASMIYFYAAEGRVSIHELMITIFLLLTAPVTANFVSKAFMLDGIEEADLPETGTEYGWAGYNDSPEPEPTDPET